MSSLTQDAVWLAAFAAGDRKAGTALVSRHHGAMVRYARSLVGPDADDVVQQAWVDALRGGATFAGRGSVRSWLFTLTRHAAFRSKRLRAGQPKEQVDLESLALAAGWGSDPETLVGNRLEASHLSAALSRLPPLSREMLTLIELEGLSGPQVARMLDVSIGAVKSRLHRARLELAAAVRKEFGDGA